VNVNSRGGANQFELSDGSRKLPYDKVPDLPMAMNFRASKDEIFEIGGALRRIAKKGAEGHLSGQDGQEICTSRRPILWLSVFRDSARDFLFGELDHEAEFSN
jgi:hypothetical protein